MTDDDCNSLPELKIVVVYIWISEAYANMNTFLARANTIFAFTLTVLATLTFGCFLTTAFNDYTSTVVIDSTTAMV